MTMPDHIQLEHLRREFKNYSRNFLNISLTARTWHLLTSICLVRWKQSRWQIFRWWRRGWNGGGEVADTTDKNFFAAGFKAAQNVWILLEYMSRNKCFLSRFEYRTFYVLYPFVAYLLTLPRTISVIRIYWIVRVMETQCVSCKAITEFVNISCFRCRLECTLGQILQLSRFAVRNIKEWKMNNRSKWQSRNRKLK
jgi:hypothetical protein